MKIVPAATFALVLMASALPLAPTAAQAVPALQRCENADGSTAYTDLACAALGATSRPLPAEVLNRIARDEVHADLDAAGTSDAPTAAAPQPVARRSALAGCARTPTQLAMDLHGSLAMDDVNRVAESYHWVGMSQTQSQPIMQQLEKLAGRPVEDMRYFDAQIGPGGMQLASTAASNGASGVLQLTVGGTARQVVDFDVKRFAGCYFVKF